MVDVIVRAACILLAAHVKRELEAMSKASTYTRLFLLQNAARVTTVVSTALFHLLPFTEQKRAKRLGFLGKFKVRARRRRCLGC